MWEKIDKINNPELKSKAARLPKLFNVAYADSTLLKYKAAWHRWVEWTHNYSESTVRQIRFSFVFILTNLLLTRHHLAL